VVSEIRFAKRLAQSREVAKKARKLGVLPGTARHTCPGVPSGGQVCVRKLSQPQKKSESEIGYDLAMVSLKTLPVVWENAIHGSM